jgi:hypothetical protein
MYVSICATTSIRYTSVTPLSVKLVMNMLGFKIFLSVSQANLKNNPWEYATKKA